MQALVLQLRRRRLLPLSLQQLQPRRLPLRPHLHQWHRLKRRPSCRCDRPPSLPALQEATALLWLHWRRQWAGQASPCPSLQPAPPVLPVGQPLLRRARAPQEQPQPQQALPRLPIRLQPLPARWESRSRHSPSPPAQAAAVPVPLLELELVLQLIWTSRSGCSVRPDSRAAGRRQQPLPVQALLEPPLLLPLLVQRLASLPASRQLPLPDRRPSKLQLLPLVPLLQHLPRQRPLLPAAPVRLQRQVAQALSASTGG